MHKVERARVDPWRLGVVDLEVQVWRHPAGLDGAEVGANDFSARELVVEVSRPDACARTDVDEAMGVLQRCDEEAAVQHEIADMVEQVLSVLLGFAIRQDVLAFAVGTVATPVLVFVVLEAREVV